MAHPYQHTLSSVKKCGGKREDYGEIHAPFDKSKQGTADFRHHAPASPRRRDLHGGADHRIDDHNLARYYVAATRARQWLGIVYAPDRLGRALGAVVR